MTDSVDGPYVERRHELAKSIRPVGLDCQFASLLGQDARQCPECLGLVFGCEAKDLGLGLGVCLDELVFRLLVRQMFLIGEVVVVGTISEQEELPVDVIQFIELCAVVISSSLTRLAVCFYSATVCVSSFFLDSVCNLISRRKCATAPMNSLRWTDQSAPR